MKHEVCVMKQDRQKMTLMSVSCQFKRHKTLDMKVEVDPEHSHFANVNIFWDTRRQIQSVVSESNRPLFLIIYFL